ncbi:MAG: helix-turn-helix domain-containing protein [Lachnospiraceae bacterium]|nr:helix-turn-helix domain-containing protein [Lachnospiraceae bacterium]
MANGTGNPLKKARIAADMTQKELADAVEGVSPTDISKAERGIADLTPEQLKAVADVLGTTEENLLATDETDAPEEGTLPDHAAEEIPVAEDGPEETPAATNSEASEETEREISDDPGTMPEAEDETIINLFRTADPARQKAAISVLKGEKQVCPDIMSLFSGMMSGANGGEFVKKMSDFINSDSGKSMINTFKGMAANRANAKGMPNEKAIFNSLPTFTYCYSVTIYTLFLSFYFWQLRTDIKPEN